MASHYSRFAAKGCLKLNKKNEINNEKEWIKSKMNIKLKINEYEK